MYLWIVCAPWVLHPIIIHWRSSYTLQSWMPKDVTNIIHFPCKFHGPFFKKALVAGHVQFFLSQSWMVALSSRHYISMQTRRRAVSLFSVVRRAKRETRKWPRMWLMARDRRGTKKERLPSTNYAAKPERMIFNGLVIFWPQSWSVDRPGTWNVTLEFAWTTEVYLLC